MNLGGNLRARRTFRVVRAQLRDLRVLLRESWFSLFLFIGIVVAGTLIFWFFYPVPEGESPLEISEALHATFALIFFEEVLAYPDLWYLQVLFFLIPILGLAVIIDGLLRFSTALTNKQSRGQKWQVAMASIYNDHVIVCGLGKIGYRVILELLNYGRDVVTIELNPDSHFIEKMKALGVPVIIEDARRSENLIKANVGEAIAIIPCTGNELANLDIALEARELQPGIKVVMRMFDPDLARRVEKGFGIHTAFSTSALAAPIFAAAAMRVDVKHSLSIGDTVLNLGEVIIAPESGLIGWTVKKVEDEFDLSLASYQDGDEVVLHPEDSYVLKSGAKIIVVAELEDLRRLNAMNQV
jgi:Trk K+ transport system NAD-binding subunit